MDIQTNWIKGFKFSAIAAGIKHADSDRLDLGLVAAEVSAVAAGVTTTNLVCAAPVEITRRCLEKGLCRAVLINSGNANAYTGDGGRQDALDLNLAVAHHLGTNLELIIPMSTGVIGNPLPKERMLQRIPELVLGVDRGSFGDVATAMMTTDTRPKTVCLDGWTSNGPFRILGMAKGAGMIAPNMATMLALILTDIRVEVSFLRESILHANSKSFNSITVDGDTSTNDTLVVLAGGAPDALELGPGREDREIFSSMLDRACTDLSRQIVLDGEGATKAVEVRVCGAPDEDSARLVARAIAESPLVKSAFHGEDPNWGRIICSAGRAGVLFEPDRIDLFIGNVPIVRQGVLVQGDWESAAHEVMQAHEFSVLLDLKTGKGEAVMLTTDLSEEYVTINADYRS